MSNLFEKIANEINHEYEPGIGAEIRSFIEYQGEDINEFKLSYDQNSESFILKIVTNGMKLDDVQELFTKLVVFVEYSHATFYIADQLEKSMHYKLLSYSKTYKGFILDVEIF